MNVLFIITDQQRADHLSCMGNPILKTPNIDSIANDGVRFTKYFCTTPICMPNRARAGQNKFKDWSTWSPFRFDDIEKLPLNETKHLFNSYITFVL